VVAETLLDCISRLRVEERCEMETKKWWKTCGLGFILAVATAGCAVGSASEDGTDSVDGLEGVPVHAVAPEDIFFLDDVNSDGIVEKDECNGRASRPDITGAAYYFGHYGNWGCMQECPPGSYAYGIAMKSESSQGSGDDTAANGVRLDCYTKAGTYSGSVTSSQQKWGSWRGTAVCPTFSNPIAAQQIRVEAPRLDNDDTTLNSVSVYCKGFHWITPPTATSWGSWWEAAYCPVGSAVCGLRTQVEADQGSGGDDTALNSTSMLCCTY
jgi:hypothetical protein